MKFRGKMIDGNCIKQFMSLLATMSKLGKSCVVRITTTHMYFIIKEPQSISCSPVIWCSMEEGHFFSQYDMEGINQVDNEIYLEFIAENVSKTLSVLKVSASAKSVKIKLTRKISPCLTFEIDLPSGSSHSRLIVHDIPVSIIARRHWPEYIEPESPNSDISVHLPQLRLMKNIVERMKNLTNMATFHVTSEGSLTLTVETDMVSVTSHFEDLHVEKSREEESSVTIELKRLSNFLANEQLNPNRVVCDVVHSKMVHLNFLSDSYQLQFFLPGISS